MTTTPRRVEYVPLDDVKPAERNPKRHDAEGIGRSISRFGVAELPLLDERTGRLVAGHGRINDLLARFEGGQEPPDGVRIDSEGRWLVPITRGWASRSDIEAEAYLVASNRLTERGGWDDEGLAELLAAINEVDPELLLTAGYDDDDLAALLGDDDTGWSGGGNGDGVNDEGEARKSLAERFGVPPFTLLDARQGYWQTRKKAWIALGLRSEEGRAAGMVGGFANASSVDAKNRGRDYVATGHAAGTSIFDPVLCELLIRWYSAPGHRVLDPFAGGSVRGLVAARLDRAYTGIDLRAEQVEANERQADDWAGRGLIGPDKNHPDLGLPIPRWLVGDSRVLRDLVPATEAFDLMLTCPPYFDLEQYSDDPADLSRAANYETFLADYRECLAAATDRMAPNAFAAIVTGAVRNRRGYVCDLPSDTTRIMESLGWFLYQDAVLAALMSTASLRAARGFVALRKLARVHQMVGVYHRGNLDAVRQWPPVEVALDAIDVMVED